MNIDAREAIVILLKGIFYRDSNQKAWSELTGGSYGAIKDYLEVIGLELVIDENEGYAYLKNTVWEDETQTLSKLIIGRELSYKVSLLCVLLRKEIVESDMQNENLRAIISHEDIKKELQLYLPTKYNETKIDREIDTIIKKVEALGFLKKLKNQESNYEIRRSIKAFVDASWLDEFDKRLAEYEESGVWS